MLKSWTLADEVKLNFDHCKSSTFWSTETTAKVHSKIVLQNRNIRKEDFGGVFGWKLWYFRVNLHATDTVHY